MRRVGSYIAEEIDREYRRKKAFEKRQRVNCKDKNCIDCKYNMICENNEVEVDG